MRVLLFILFFSVSLVQAGSSVMEVRELFYRAAKSSDSADSLLEKLTANPDTKDPFIIAYRGMAQLLTCYHSYNPYTKYKYFLRGKNSLEQAIKLDSNNIEYRFLRLSVQLNTPSFLGYNNKTAEDKLKIFTGLRVLRDQDLFTRISNYTLTAKKITAEEKKKVKEALSANPYLKLGLSKQ